MCFGCYRIICAAIPACCFYSKTERKSTYECVRCLKAFMNNKVSHNSLSTISRYSNSNVILPESLRFSHKKAGGVSFFFFWFFGRGFYKFLFHFKYIFLHYVDQLHAFTEAI